MTNFVEKALAEASDAQVATVALFVQLIGLDGLLAERNEALATRLPEAVDSVVLCKRLQRLYDEPYYCDSELDNLIQTEVGRRTKLLTLSCVLNDVGIDELFDAVEDVTTTVFDELRPWAVAGERSL